MNQKPMSKYFICEDCAKSKGLLLRSSVFTASEGLCGWCKDGKLKMMTPVRDFYGAKRT